MLLQTIPTRTVHSVKFGSKIAKMDQSYDPTKINFWWKWGKCTKIFTQYVLVQTWN